jgi:N-acetylmuramoyl-L-alanine amidase
VTDQPKGTGEVWDPGHGGPDPGAVDPIQPAEGDTIDSREDDIALDVALAIRKLRPGAALTRESDKAVDLVERARISNRHDARLFVSLHFNSATPTARGVEVFYHGKSPKGQRLATCLYIELTKEFPELPQRGVRSDLTRYQSGFAVLRETVAPAALVEWAFLSNPDDERAIAGPEAVERAARALSRGVDKYLASEGVA